MLAEITKDYEVVIGLEVHAQLKTKTKLMSAAQNETGGAPNHFVSTICAGFPGALPVLNKEAVEMAALVGLALGCKIAPKSIFSRKHYFYPDLPKGYQISQYDRPYAEGGAVEFFLNGEKRSIGLIRIHLEEDAGKNLHFDDRGVSLVDFNRSSVPLIEIVSKPDLRSPEEAVAYLKALRLVLRYLNICEGDLEEGNFRCDANVSLRRHGAEKYGTRVEVKNINSFRNLERAVIFEIQRQYALIESGMPIDQETRLWDADRGQTFSMRSKEEAADYRYMPEPDLTPLRLSDEFLANLRKQLPELPMAKMDRFMREFERSAYDAEVLTASQDLANYFEAVCRTVKDSHLVSNFIQTNVLACLKDIERDLKGFYPDAQALSELLLKVKDKTLSLGLAKEVFEIMRETKKDAMSIIAEKNLSQISDATVLTTTIQEILDANPKQVEEYRQGKEKMFGFFMGQCQKKLQGKADPSLLKDLLTKLLKGNV